MTIALPMIIKKEIFSFSNMIVRKIPNTGNKL